MSVAVWVLAAFFVYAALAYLVDVPLRRALAARSARAYARSQGRPLLNVGAGTWDSALCGPTLYGDVNVDLHGDYRALHGTPGVVSRADVQDLPFRAGHFGAVLASHVIEHVPDPDRALAELRRVVGGWRGVHVITPSWWAPHTWLHPGHRWFFVDGQGGLRGGARFRLRGSARRARRLP